MKWAVLTGLLVLGTIAGVYAYVATGREHGYRERIDSGEAAMARDDHAAAIEEFSGAIALKPDSMLGHLKRGEAYLRRGDYDAALRDLRRATDLDASALPAQELLADVNYALARYDRAAQRYDVYLRLDDGSPRILYKQALAYYSGGEPGPAIAALRKAIGLDEKFAEAHYLLALCLRDVLDPRGALAALEKALALAPGMLQAREELADLYRSLGRQGERIKQLEVLFGRDPGPSREVALALAYADAGRLESAVLRLGEATERYPDHAHTYVALGRVWLETAQRDRGVVTRRVSLTKALAALERAVRSDTSSEALTLLGRALLMAGEDDERAERVLRQASDTLPVDPLSFYHLAEAAERRGRLDVARRALLDYDAIRDGDRDGRRAAALAERIAELSMRLNDPGLAARYYQRAADASPANSGLLLRLADAQWKAGRVDAARTTVNSILEKAPHDRQALTLWRRLR